MQLSDRQIEILALIDVDSTFSAKDISKKMSEKVSEKNNNVERTIERDNAKLKKLGILSRTGGRKNGEWIIQIGKKGDVEEGLTGANFAPVSLKKSFCHFRVLSRML